MRLERAGSSGRTKRPERQTGYELLKGTMFRRANTARTPYVDDWLQAVQPNDRPGRGRSPLLPPVAGGSTNPMRIRKIAKGGGRFRTIYCPNSKEKRRLRDLLPLLNEIHTKAVDAAGTRGVAHAFVANRNPVTCAMPHRGFQVTVSCDLENWFDSVTAEHLRSVKLFGVVPPEVIAQVTIPDEHSIPRCRQGLPTSPVAANIAAIPMDVAILYALKTLCGDGQFAYTRYADDLTVSFNNPLLVPLVLYALRHAAMLMCWTIAEHKTHIQHAKAGRRIIVGIAVDDRVQATRKTRRKLRAARHNTDIANVNGVKEVKIVGINQGAAQSAAGLAEWAACKLPRAVRCVRRIPGAMGGAVSATVASKDNTQAVAVASSGRRVLVPVREKIADESADK